MKIIETTFEKLPTKCLLIGFEGENLRATVRIDCASVFAEYPNATPALIVKPLFADAYPVVVDRNGTDVDWLITSEILSFNGDGEIQLVFYKDEVICKSAITKIRVCRSLQVTGEMPDPVVQWIENANRKLAEVDAQIVELEGMVDTATDAATRAEQSASTASTKAEQAAGSAATATEKATEATNAAGTATAKAAEAQTAAQTATDKANAAAESERIATAKAGDATTAAGTATAKAEQATEAAQTATEKAADASASATAAHASATDAASSATAASASETAAKASETAASASATQAAQSAQGASTAAQTATQKAAEATQSASNAATSATNAETYATTASTKAGEAAQSAQAVEETAEQLAESLEQISQNTADIAEHEQEYNALKEATLIHNSASGSIASFVDGAEMPVDELKVQIEPVQDLHGYDHPWPGGGGKNLFDPDANPNKWIGADGALTNVTGAKTSQKIQTGGEIKTFTVSNGDNQTSILCIAGYDSSDNLVTRTAQNGVRYLTFETTAEMAYIRAANYTEHPTQLEQGSTATAYAPYSNICPITGWTGVKVTRTGKNLYSRENGEYNAPVYAVDGSVASYPDVNTVWLKVKPNTTYHVSFVEPTNTFYFRWINCDKNKWFISRSGNTYGSNTTIPDFTTTAETEWVEIAVNQYDTNNLSKNDWLICISETSTDYEPYQGETYTVTFPSEAGTVYGGSLTIAEDGSGVLTVDMAMVDIGTLNYGYNSTYKVFSAYKGDIKPHGYCVSSQYKYGNGVSAPDMSCCLGYSGWFVNNLCIKDSRYSVPADFKAAMNGVQLVYELATPVTYTLTASQITTLLGTNNVWADTGDVSVKYNADTKLYIDGKIAELVAQIVNS